MQTETCAGRCAQTNLHQGTKDNAIYHPKDEGRNPSAAHVPLPADSFTDVQMEYGIMKNIDEIKAYDHGFGVLENKLIDVFKMSGPPDFETADELIRLGLI